MNWRSGHEPLNARVVASATAIAVLTLGTLGIACTLRTPTPSREPAAPSISSSDASLVPCPALDPERVVRLELSAGEQAVLRGACDRIAASRRTEVALSFVDAQGAPIRGPVQVEQVRHLFRFGGHPNEAAAGTLNSTESTAYDAVFLGIFNHAVWGFPWRTLEPTRGLVRLDFVDRALEWTERRGVTLRGHALIYAQAQPRWLVDLADAQEQQRLVEAHVRSVVERTRGRVIGWDIVNEPKNTLTLTLMQRGQQLLSPQISEATVRAIADYAAPPFRWARETDPAAVLIINDNRIVSGRQIAKVEAILKELQRRGTPLDGVGIQIHAREEGRVPLDLAQQHLDRVAQYGRLYLTEISVPSRPQRPDENVFDSVNWHGWSEQTQADYAVALFTLGFGHPAVDEITYWSLTDRRDDPPTVSTGLMRSDLTPRPAYQSLKDLVRSTWWTRVSVNPDSHGAARLHVFLGDHTATTTLSDGRRVVGTFSVKRPSDPVVVMLR